MASEKIINGLKELERAAEGRKVALGRLRRAANEVAALIEEVAPVGVDLPRGYRVVEIETRSGLRERFLDYYPGGLRPPVYIDGVGEYLGGDLDCYVPAPSREALLQFAQDIASGLLEEIAALLEGMKTEEERAANTLEGAARLLKEQIGGGE